MLYRVVLTILLLSFCLSVSGGQTHPIEIDKVVGLAIETFDQPDPAKSKGRKCRIEGAKAQKLLYSLSIGTPEEPGSPAAMITGHISLSTRSGKRTFKIYNGLLLNDEQEPTVYFRLKTPITSALCSS